MEMLIKLSFILFCLLIVYCQLSFKDDCSDAPTEELRQICLRLRAKDKNARRRFENRRNNKTRIGPPGVSSRQPVILPLNGRGQVATSPYECMTLICLCPFFSGKLNKKGVCILSNGLPLGQAFRKEYRLLSDAEKRKFHKAFNQMKASGEYDRFAREHREVAEDSGAHSGPGFLPWHREFLKRIEIALRLIDPTMAIPYWDSVMDGYLPDPRDSIIFSSDFMGETDLSGNLITGPFAFWRTIEGHPTIRRNLGREGQLMTELQVNLVLAQTNIEYVLAYIIPLRGCPYPPNFNAIEYTHANVHVWLGGDMFDQITSANDPVFYLHHSFVDLIWENWRHLRQPRDLREINYPPDLPQCASPLHFSRAQLAPYNLMLRDGLSNLYTDQLYKYAPRAMCTIENQNCGSKYLFCDTRPFPHCVSKIKIGGRCDNFEMFDACYNGRCLFNRCVAVRPPQPSRNAPRAQEIPETKPLIPRRFTNCFNFHPCCDLWESKGECQANPQFMNQFCKASCHQCQPAYNVTNDCQNRHVSCVEWQREGQCVKGDSVLFLHENCRESCGLCGIPKCIDRPNIGVIIPVQTRPSSPPQLKSGSIAISTKARKNLTRQRKRRPNVNMRARKVSKKRLFSPAKTVSVKN